MPINKLKKLLDTHLTGTNRRACKTMLRDHLKRIKIAPGSKRKHQAWPGGYVGHITECIEIAAVTYAALSTMRPLPFALESAVLVLFLHDLEKPFKYVKPVTHFDDEEEKRAFVNDMIKRYGIELTDEERNALKYVHGEGDEYSPVLRIQKPLAAFVHHCDNTSARIWYDFPEH